MLAGAAQRDFEDIVAWTLEEWGARQARTYAATIRAALRALRDGPSVAGVRPEIGKAVHTLHVARGGRKGWHFVVFRSREATKLIEVLRILHDAMDMPRHVDE